MISMPSQTVNNLIMTALKRAKRLHITESSFYRFHGRGSRGGGGGTPLMKGVGRGCSSEILS